MKGLRFLLLGMAICLASGVKAQFYDSADDIYYYVETSRETEFEDTYIGPPPHFNVISRGKKKTTNIPEEDKAMVKVFNFDGIKAVELTNIDYYDVTDIKRRLQESSSFFEDRVENLDYTLRYVSSYSGTTYEDKTHNLNITYTFSSDRNTLVFKKGSSQWIYLKRVEKSFFKVGRSRTPSGTMHE